VGSGGWPRAATLSAVHWQVAGVWRQLGLDFVPSLRTTACRPCHGAHTTRNIHSTTVVVVVVVDCSSSCSCCWSISSSMRQLGLDFVTGVCTATSRPCHGAYTTRNIHSTTVVVVDCSSSCSCCWSISSSMRQLGLDFVTSLCTTASRPCHSAYTTRNIHSTVVVVVVVDCSSDSSSSSCCCWSSSSSMR